MIKSLQSEDLEEMIDVKVAKSLIDNTIQLLQPKQKSTERAIGIKIASYLQQFGKRGDLQIDVASLKQELIKIMCSEQSDELRKLSISNIDVTQETINYVIKRVRDKNKDIRITVFRKLLKDDVYLGNFELADIYKILYDGLGSREEQVKEFCLKYLLRNYEMFKKEEEKQSSMVEIEDQQKKGLTPKKDNAYQELRKYLINFFSIFEIERTLLYPQIYEIIELLIQEFVMQFQNAENLSLYLRELLQRHFSCKKSQSQLKIDICELFFLRVICDMVYKENSQFKQNVNQEVIQSIEDCFPNGIELSKIIEYYGKEGKIMELYQCLLLAELQINCDESGKIEILNILNNICLLLPYKEISLTQEQEICNDVYYRINSKEQLNMMKVMQGFHEKPIISNSNDLFQIIARLFKKLMNDNAKDYTLKLTTLINEIYSQIVGDDEEQQGLFSQLQDILKRITINEQDILKLEEDLKKLRKNKKQTQQIYELDTKASDLKKFLAKLNEDKQNVQSRISQIQCRALVLSQSMLVNCQIDNKDTSIIDLMKNVILPQLQSEQEDNLEVIELALRCLAMLALMSEQLFLDYSTIFEQLLQTNIEQFKYQRESVQEIISLKLIVDSLIMYKHLSSGQMNQDQLIKYLIQYACFGKINLRQVAIEGLCKILFSYTTSQSQNNNNSLPNSTNSGKQQEDENQLQLLLLILNIFWHDPNVIQQGGYKIIQILSAFMRQYILSDSKNIEYFQLSIEILLQLIIQMNQSGLDFNNEIVGWSTIDGEIIINIIRVVIQMYKTLNQQLLPQEEQLFAYLCLKLKQYPEQIAYLDKTIQYFDIIEKSDNTQLQILHQLFKDMCANVKNGKQEIENFKKQIDAKVDQILVIEQRDNVNIQQKQVQIDQGIDSYITKFSTIPQNLSVIKKNLLEYDIIQQIQNSNKGSNKQRLQGNRVQYNKNMTVSEIREIDLMLEEQHQQIQEKEENEELKANSVDMDNNLHDNFEDEIEQKQQLFQSQEKYIKNKKKIKQSPTKNEGEGESEGEGEGEATLNDLMKLTDKQAMHQENVKKQEETNEQEEEEVKEQKDDEETVDAGEQQEELVKKEDNEEQKPSSSQEKQEEKVQVEKKKKHSKKASKKGGKNKK